MLRSCKQMCWGRAQSFCFTNACWLSNRGQINIRGRWAMLQGPFPLQTTELRPESTLSLSPSLWCLEGQTSLWCLTMLLLPSPALHCWTLVEKPHKRANHCMKSDNIEETPVHNVLSGNLPTIPIPVSLAVIKHWPKQLGKKRVDLDYRW